MDLGKLRELSGRRVCVVCGRVFRTGQDREGRVQSALQKLAEHLVEHQPEPGQWTEAYGRIRAATPKRQKGLPMERTNGEATHQ